jgi:phytoene dehydrogenase-like protein
VAGEDHSYNLVISNADVLSTYRTLLDAPDVPEALAYGKLEPSSSGLVFLWSMKARHAELQSHNIFFSASYTREFGDIFGGGTGGIGGKAVGGIGGKAVGGIGAPADPTVYVNITSRTSPEDAPAGGENWFVLVNASSNRGQDWDTIAADIERDAGSTYGSLYGITSNDRFSAFFRHPNRSRRIKGLYFAGGSAHPGGGMPLAVLSGIIAAELVLKYEDR